MKPNARPVTGPAAWLPLVVLVLSALPFYRTAKPWVFMWALAIAIFMGLKWLTWWTARGQVVHTAARSGAYLFAWPGMDAKSFLDETTQATSPTARRWLWAILETSTGAALLWGVARMLPSQHPLARGWTGMLGMILLLHFGVFQLIALFWQSFGIAAWPIMSAPLRSMSLSEFWGKRWNLGFRQLAHDFVFSTVRRKLGAKGAGFLVFVLSGLIHDFVISVPARGGYGLPTMYFVLQGIGVTFERSRAARYLGLGEGLRGWMFVVLVTLGPVYWLFHPPFVLRVIIPFMRVIRAI
jgi:Membrane bound O-acyl transferase family